MLRINLIKYLCGGKEMYNILICDDQVDIVEALKIYLGSAGYNTFEAYNGIEALDIIDNNEIHLILLDIMMPEMDGLTTISKIRKISNIPVIFLTAKSEDTDIILGLDLGADDYITKPFKPTEVQARVRSHLRRYLHFGSGNNLKARLQVAGLELDDKAKEFRVDGEVVNLTPTEFDIMKLFMERPGEVISPKEIYRNVWNEDPFGADSTVAVHIRHLREKIEIDPANPRYLKVVWAKGYKLERGRAFNEKINS